MAPLGAFLDPRVPNSLFYRFFKNSDKKLSKGKSVYNDQYTKL